MRRAALLLGTSLLLPLTVQTAAASQPPTLDAPESTPRIFGGQPTAPCEWPSTVSMGGICSGTLVHPEIVIYAGHCGEVPWAWFGETLDDTGAGRYVDTEYCEVNPEYNSLGTNTDFSFCKLAEPVTDIEIVPILMGCETQLLQPGAEVVAVGFGYDEFDHYGTKKAVTFPINIVSGEVQAGGDGLSICNGDSGGPLFMRLPPELDPEQSWRVFGVTSWGPQDCAEPQWFGTMNAAVGWIEARSGIDITPCHNADGSWQAGPDCGRFPLSPGTGSGTWTSWCEDQAVGGSSATCGEPTVAEDLVAPTAAIIDPIDQTVFDSDPETSLAALTITGEASDVGWGIASVELWIDGSPIPNGAKSFPPWTWSAAFPAGGYTLELVATDLSGNFVNSEPVHIGVDQDPPMPEPEPETETGSDGLDESDSGDDPALADDDSGCSCSTDPGAPAPAGALLFVLAGLGLRRRRQTRR